MLCHCKSRSNTLGKKQNSWLSIALQLKSSDRILGWAVLAVRFQGRRVHGSKAGLVDFGCMQVGGCEDSSASVEGIGTCCRTIIFGEHPGFASIGRRMKEL